MDDVGGSWGLESLVKALQKWDKDCTDAECREGELSGDKRFWYGWGKKAAREKFLSGPSVEDVTTRLSELFSDDKEAEHMNMEFVVDSNGAVAAPAV